MRPVTHFLLLSGPTGGINQAVVAEFEVESVEYEVELEAAVEVELPEALVVELPEPPEVEV